MRHGIGEQLIENNQQPRPLVIGQVAFPRERLSKGLQPRKLQMFRAYRDRAFHLAAEALPWPYTSKTVINREGIGLSIRLATALLIAAAGMSREEAAIA